MASPKKILQLTNSEHGQANVHLAVASSIILSDPTVQIHIASYPRLADFVSEASDFAIQKSPEASPFVFHKLPGATFEECVVHKSVDFFSVARKTPGIWNSAALIKGVSSCCTPWNSEQFLETYEGVVQVIEEVDPDIIVVDCFFCPGLSVCHNAKRNWLILSPNSVKDFSLAQQPNLSGLWGFPRFGLINQWPVPWYQWPLNLLYNLIIVYYISTDSRMRDVRRSFKARTGGDALLVVDLLKSPPSGIPLLTSNSPEIEFPMIIPPGLIPCGPILRPASSVEVADPALAGWLASGPTVYINLGSHFITQEDQAIELAKALRLVFDITEKNSTLSGLRVLWKIKRPSEAPYGFEDKSPIHEIIGKEMDDDRVRIESWINVEPQAILNSGHVICSVNHGGASSWNEAVSAGVPQVVLPQWIDTYDYAVRTEMLGVGLYGNRKTQPRWSVEELAPKLLKATLGDSAATMRKKAQGFAKNFQERPEGIGRDYAARFILDRITQ